MHIARTLKLAALLLVVMVLSMAVYGFANANTFNPSHAGDGEKVISGYAITNIKYNLNASNPGSIDSVTFTTDTAPVAGSTIKIKLIAAGSTWYTCSNIGTAVTCNNGSALNAPVDTADSLRIVIAD
jgi:hypothetical protein